MTDKEIQPQPTGMVVIHIPTNYCPTLKAIFGLIMIQYFYITGVVDAELDPLLNGGLQGKSAEDGIWGRSVPLYKPAWKSGNHSGPFLSNLTTFAQTPQPVEEGGGIGLLAPGIQTNTDMGDLSVLSQNSTNLRDNDTMIFNNTSDKSSNASVNVHILHKQSVTHGKLAIGGHTYVIIMLSGLVVLAILFTLCGLFHKAEAHKKPDFDDGLLFDSRPNHMMTSFFDTP